jgi:hypothetical protein
VARRGLASDRRYSRVVVQGTPFDTPNRLAKQDLAELREQNRSCTRRQYLSRRLHGLGARAFSEFLDEINRYHDLAGDLDRRLEAYVTRLTPELLLVTGSDRMPASMFRIIASGRGDDWR